jgi:hypothetical protein
MVFTYIPLPLMPKVPQRFVDLALKTVEEKYDTDESALGWTYNYDPSYTERKINIDGEEFGSNVQRAYTLGADWEKWVKENIVTEFFDRAAVRVAHGGHQYTGAHIDPPGPKWKLYYLLQTGGDNVTTSWYKEKDQPLVRFSGTDNVICVSDYSKLELIDRTILPLNQWVLLNTNILHGVENITGRRINISITLQRRHPITDFLNFHFYEKH